MQEVILSELHSLYGLRPISGNPYAKIDRNGLHIRITTYEVRNLGHLSVIDMKAMLGLMKMESVVLSADTKDLPLFSSDLIRFPGKQTLLLEFYDNMLEPLSENAKAAYRKAKNKYKDLPPYNTGQHWYERIRYDFSFASSGKGLKEKERAITADYFNAYLENLATAPRCDPGEKRIKTAGYVEGLFRNGGPAADQFRKLIGDDATRDVFEKYIFCCR